MRYTSKAVLSAIILVNFCFASGPAGLNDALETKLLPVVLDFRQTPLSVALDRVSVATGQDPVLFGAQVETQDGKEPLVSGMIDAGSDVKGALTMIMAAVPGYSFAPIGPHLINVAVSTYKPDSPLDIKVPQLHIADVVPSNFLNNPARFIPELKLAMNGGTRRGCAIGPGIGDTGIGVRVDATDTTVRDLLNLVSTKSIDIALTGAGLPTVGYTCRNRQKRRKFRQADGEHWVYGA